MSDSQDTEPTLIPLVQPGTGHLDEPSSSASYESNTGFVSVNQITGRHQAIVGPASGTGAGPKKAFADLEMTPALRLRAGVWGGAAGTILGIVLGVLNAFFEGTTPSPTQRPLLILALVCCLLFAAVSAYIPKTCHQILCDLKLISPSS